MDDDLHIWRELKTLYDSTRSPVPTAIVADFAGYSHRHARRKLNKLATIDSVSKAGKRGGWVPVCVPRPQYEQLMLPLFAA